jgi:acyl-CoA thioesterase
MNDIAIAKKSRDAMWSNDLASQDLGIEVEVNAPGTSVARFEIRANMVNGHDICHGGYIFTLADTAFAFACNSYNRVTLAASGSIEFVRPGKLGDTLVAKAEEAHRGGRTGIYDVIVRNQDDALVAIFRGRSYATQQPLFESDTKDIEKP